MTLAQQTASNPDYCVWVAASAGTGKTKVLTDRVLRLLLQGVDPSKIICLTFTKAAAAEMSNRIQSKLADWVLMSDEALIAYLEPLAQTSLDGEDVKRARQMFARILDIPDGLKIQTLHSFCQMLMRKFPIESGIAPHFQVIDDRVSGELIRDSINRLLLKQDDYDADVRASIYRVITHVFEGRFNAIIEDLIAQRSSLQAMLNARSIEQWQVFFYDQFNVPVGMSAQQIKEAFCAACDHDDIFRSVARSMVEVGSKTQQTAGQVLCDWLVLPASERVGIWDQYVSVFMTGDHKPRKRLLTKAIDALHIGADDLFRRQQSNLLQCLEQMRSAQLIELTIDVIRIGAIVIAHYKQLKASRAYLDYYDLIDHTKQLLQHNDVAPWVLYKLDGGVDHLLVDEAQDTSPDQWQIIAALCEEFFAGESAQDQARTIFVVGDEKQSIYSFQGADPDVFHAMHKLFGHRIAEANKPWQSIDLDRSFRSTSAVLGVVDECFNDQALKSSVTFKMGAIEHTVHRKGDGGLVECWPLVQYEHDHEPDDVWPLPVMRTYSQDPIKLLATHVSDSIGEWLHTKRILPSKGRPVEPGDIMILVRRRNELVDALVSAFKREGIPVAGADRMILDDHLAVQDLVALGKWLLLPEDDLVLAEVLKSPLIGCTEDQLYELAYGRHGSLYESLCVKKQRSDQFVRAYDYLSRLLGKVDFVTPSELYAYILDGAGGRRHMIARLGEQVNDPIDEFLSLARSYEQSHVPTMQGFIEWVQSEQVQIKRDMEQDGNHIRIMTVHGSKGLQSPIVLLPDTTSVPKSMPQLLWSGSGLTHEQDSDTPFVVWSPNRGTDNEYTTAVRSEYQTKQYNEYIRLLYVAMTRAEDELYIAGYQTHHEPPAGSWYQIIRSAMERMGAQGEVLRIEHDHHTSLVAMAPETMPEEPDKAVLDVSDYSWLTHTVSREPLPLMPLIASEPVTKRGEVTKEWEQKAIIRGQATHRLLQFLPTLPSDVQHDAAERYLARYGTDIDRADRDAIAKDVYAILHDESLSTLFAGQSKAEVPIAGAIGRYSISGTIDRLVITDDKVLVVDYKTNRTVPKLVSDVPNQYLKQMAIYKMIIANIYPDKRVVCSLLWTAGPTLMALPDELVDSYQIEDQAHESVSA